MPTFKNRQNSYYRDENGKMIWVSRSCAIEINLFAIYNHRVYALIQKRSGTMMDCPNMWGITSGYLDWDESAWECGIRELYEETGIDIEKYKESIIEDNNHQPFNTLTEPYRNRQNVILEFIIILNFDKSGQQFPIEIEEYKNKEIAVVEWLDMENFLLTEKEKRTWAFGHDERILKASSIFKHHFLHI